MKEHTDPFEIIGAALLFYDATPATDGTVPPGPNPLLVEDSGKLARAALVALDELAMDYATRYVALLRMMRDIKPKGALPWPGWTSDHMIRGDR